MLTACVTLSLPPICLLSIKGFKSWMLSVQVSACTLGSKGCYNKDIHSNTFSQPFVSLRLLDNPFAFYLVISNINVAKLIGSLERIADARH